MGEDEDTISRVMREMGSKGGKVGGPKGGRARMDQLSEEERKALGKSAADARWGREKAKKAAAAKAVKKAAKKKAKT